MISQENYDNYNQDDSSYDTDPAVSYRFDDARSADHQPTELDHDDEDRRTLDESQADEDDED